MRTVVKVLFLMLALSCTTGKKAMFLNELLARSTIVQTSEGRGTGVIISKGIVLTNAHLFHEDVEIRVNNKKATVLKKDMDRDLMLLSVETAPVHSVTLARNVVQDDEIVVVGNPLGHTGMVTRGHVIDITAGKIYIDAHIFFGSSGGGVYTPQGELVGVVVGIEGGTGDGFPFGIVIPSSVISDFLLKSN